MKVDLIRIGNSRGIRIPKAIIEQCGFGDSVEVRVDRERLVITPDRRPRQGWKESFTKAKSRVDPLLLGDLPANEFDRDEWTW